MVVIKNSVAILPGLFMSKPTWPRIAVNNVFDCRYVSDCRSRGREFDPGPVPYFRGD